MFFTIPSSTLLQLGTGSLLVAMLGSRAVGQALQALGEASEEVFRGDRLPILKFPVETETEEAGGKASSQAAIAP